MILINVEKDKAEEQIKNIRNKVKIFLASYDKNETIPDINELPENLDGIEIYKDSTKNIRKLIDQVKKLINT